MRHRTGLRSFLAFSVLATMLAGSVFAADYAFDRDRWTISDEGNWSQKITAGQNRGGTSGASLATPSGYAPASDWTLATPSSSEDWTLATPSSYRLDSQEQFTPGEMLEQDGNNPDAVELIKVQWFRISLEDKVIRDSKDPQCEMPQGQEIEPDGKLTFELRADFRIDPEVTEPGNYVEWKLGTFPGLALPEQISEEIELSGHRFGTAYLRYTDDEVYIGTVFSDEIENYISVFITYNYESGFEPVYEKTPLPFIFAGQDKEQIAYLLPTERPDETEPSETEPTETEPAETETTAPETAAPEETKPPEADHGSDNGSSDSGGSTSQSGGGRPVRPGTSSGGSGDAAGPGADAAAEAQAVQELPTETDMTAAEAGITTDAAVDDIDMEEMEEAQDAQDAEDAQDAGEESPDDEPSDTEKLEVRITALPDADSASGSTEFKNGGALTCSIEIRNEGSAAVRDIRLRDYLPEHMSFVSASEDGVWAVLGGRQRVTWKLDELGPGESRTLELKLQIYPCTSKGSSLVQTVYWQAEDDMSVHSAKDPEESLTGAEITVG